MGEGGGTRTVIAMSRCERVNEFGASDWLLTVTAMSRYERVNEFGASDWGQTVTVISSCEGGKGTWAVVMLCYRPISE